jgi:hypothetical protein
MRRSCSDSLLTASQVDGVFRSDNRDSAPAGHQDPHRQAEDMTAPTIIAPQQNNPCSTGAVQTCQCRRMA